MLWRIQRINLVHVLSKGKKVLFPTDCGTKQLLLKVELILRCYTITQGYNTYSTVQVYVLSYVLPVLSRQAVT